MRGKKTWTSKKKHLGVHFVKMRHLYQLSDSFSGDLSDFTPDLQSRLFSGADGTEVQRRSFPFYLNSEGFRYPGYWGDSNWFGPSRSRYKSNAGRSFDEPGSKTSFELPCVRHQPDHRKTHGASGLEFVPVINVIWPFDSVIPVNLSAPWALQRGSPHPLLGIAHVGNIVGFLSGINGTKVPLGLIRTVEGPVLGFQEVTVVDSKVTARHWS